MNWVNLNDEGYRKEVQNMCLRCLYVPKYGIEILSSFRLKAESEKDCGGKKDAKKKKKNRT